MFSNSSSISESSVCSEFWWSSGSLAEESLSIQNLKHFLNQGSLGGQWPNDESRTYRQRRVQKVEHGRIQGIAI